MTGSRKLRRPRARELRRVALRSTLLQAVWNYETLQSVGFAWSLMPALERMYPDREARSRRLGDYLRRFNSNPYMSTLGMGVALRIEGEVARGAAGAEERLQRLLRALHGPLGALGDQLFWGGWRPALGLVAAVLALGTGSALPAIGFIVAYNVLAQTVRFRGARAGYASGAAIARVLQDPFWKKSAKTARRIGAVGAGIAVGAGLVWADAGGGRGMGAAVFLGLITLLWLASRRIGSEERPLSPVTIHLTALLLLSALYTVSRGVLP